MKPMTNWIALLVSRQLHPENWHFLNEQITVELPYQ
jgi:hypothetical protein